MAILLAVREVFRYPATPLCNPSGEAWDSCCCGRGMPIFRHSTAQPFRGGLRVILVVVCDVF
eukprot:7733957-Alexandrium_andersonii.AAC.1